MGKVTLLISMVARPDAALDRIPFVMLLITPGEAPLRIVLNAVAASVLVKSCLAIMVRPAIVRLSPVFKLENVTRALSSR